MIRPRHRAAIAFAILVSLTACQPARQDPGIDANDLSDDRGARAGRFLPPADNAVDANDTGPAGNRPTVESNQ